MNAPLPRAIYRLAVLLTIAVATAFPAGAQEFDTESLNGMR